MAIERIDAELCNGCGICSDSCPLDVIRMDQKKNKAVIKYVQDCAGCSFCQTDCPQKAIYVSPRRDNPPLTLWGTWA